MSSAEGSESEWPVDGSTLALVGVFILSRCVYLFGLGVQFNANTLGDFQQFLDPELLRHSLVESIVHLHQQPPLFNVFLGVVLKLFPEQFVGAFQGSFLLIGLVFTVSLHRLMLQLRVHPRIAFVLTALFATSPAVILYENWLFYPYPVACLLCVSALSLTRFVSTWRHRDGLVFFGTYAALVLTRGLFRPELLLVTLGILWFACRDHRSTLLRVATVPVLVVTMFCAKQYVLFGTFTAGSSYVGRNFSLRVSPFIPEAERTDLIERGVLTEFFFRKPHRAIGSYTDRLPPMGERGVAALDEPRISTGAVNFNHVGYLAQSEAYLAEFWPLMRAHPEYYVASFDLAKRYFYPSSVHPGLRRSNARNRTFVTLLNRYEQGMLGSFPGSRYAWWLVLGLPVLWAFGARELVRRFREHRPSRWLPIAYMVLHVLYLTALTVGVSAGDYNRYRFEFDSLHLVLFGLLCTAVLARWRGPADPSA